MSNDRINAVTCTTWVPRGVAKQNPEKIEVTKEELAKIIKATSENLLELEEVQENDYAALELEALEDDMKIVSLKPEARSEDVEMKEECNGNQNNSKENLVNDDETNMGDDDKEEIEKRYDFANYDTEKEGLEAIFKLGRLTVHADNEEDPNVTVKEDDNESEAENHKILPSDNLIMVGHVDGDAAILEVYVYNNSEESSLYVHHDIFLPAVPLCMEWLNYDPTEENLKPGNMVAIGSMSPIIEVWDLDLIDTLEPAFVLGQEPKKKKKISRIGHCDAVLCLGWNKDLEHILASGSVDKSIILWDLQECKEAQKFKKFSGRVQDLKWHSKENHYLLAGSCDKNVKLFDCLTEDNCKTWQLDGEVECVTWDPTSSHSLNFFASTDTGAVYSIDARHGKPLQRIQAHNKTCTGIVMNAECPGCLITVSEDETVKIWDVLQPKTKLVEEKDPGIGIIHTVSSSPDSPFVLSLGGDNKKNNFKVWDIRQSRKVRRNFFDRLGLEEEDEAIADSDAIEEEEEEEDNDDDSLNNEGSCSAVNKTSKWKPNKKSKKKKGGHLDRKRKR